MNRWLAMVSDLDIETLENAEEQLEALKVKTYGNDERDQVTRSCTRLQMLRINLGTDYDELQAEADKQAAAEEAFRP